MAERPGLRRCAIYTRKSSEERLEQAFNSLDAQREACAAYIASQRHEGWRLVPNAYDDGGFSGGTLERPALQSLLADIRARRVDIVVVYKVDRLTRSLADFAKIVEVFDAHGVSFVSVTQQFNTTSSMGRLTLNILLSFAQFEREVTGERIRDKVAASKRKGMWMGGYIPLGYDLVDRKLIVNAAEAETVRLIFSRYAQLRCVRALATELARTGIRSKAWVARTTGRSMGGHAMSRGALYQILKNRLYRGEIAHRGQIHAGQHEAIVPPELWDAAHAALAVNRRGWRGDRPPRSPSLLVGLLVDSAGCRFGATLTIKGDRRHRYYARQRQPGQVPPPNVPDRFRADDVDRVVIERLAALLHDPVDLRRCSEPAIAAVVGARGFAAASRGLADRIVRGTLLERRDLVRRLVARVVLDDGELHVEVNPASLVTEVTGDGCAVTDVPPLRLSVKTLVRTSSNGRRLVIPPPEGQAHAGADPVLVRALALARDWHRRLLHDPAASMTAFAREAGIERSVARRWLRLAFLAPDVVSALVTGRVSGAVSVERLAGVPISLDWRVQRRTLPIRPA